MNILKLLREVRDGDITPQSAMGALYQWAQGPFDPNACFVHFGNTRENACSFEVQNADIARLAADGMHKAYPCVWIHDAFGREIYTLG